MNKKFYQADKYRLICTQAEAHPEFWDAQWNKLDAERIIRSVSPRSYYVRLTQRYLKPGDGPILEGGCGMGQYVYAFTRAGYRCTGIDYAPETVKRVKALAPELDIRAADLRSLPFPDQTFAGYWSLGIIEHYWDGYDPLAAEMARVLKPGGFLFLTFPAMSLLRRLKVRVGAYPLHTSPNAPPDFYQFILDPRAQIRTMRTYGFVPRQMRFLSGGHGLADEVPWLKTGMQALSQRARANRRWRYVETAISRAFGPVAGHIALAVFQKAA